MTKIQDRLWEARDALKDGKGGQKNEKTLQKNIDGIEQELEEEEGGGEKCVRVGSCAV